MRNKMFVFMLAAAMTIGLCACGGSDSATESSTTTESTEAESASEAPATEAAEETTEVTTEVEEVVHYEKTNPPSSSFEIVATDYVKSLADYSAIPVTISASYEITEANENTYLYSVLNGYGYDAQVEVTDRDTIQEGDIVSVDYTGYLNGEAFEGGSATEQMIDVYNNASASGSGYIDGFTDVLKGAKVGETVSGNCTFPENYSSTDLAGQEVTFEFVIHGIYRPVTLADMTDEQVSSYFGEANDINTVEELKNAIDESLQYSADSEQADQISAYLLENSEVEVPEDYLAARLDEYAYNAAESYCAADQTLEEYITAYGYDYQEMLDSWRESLRSNIAEQFVFIAIAEQEGLDLDEEGFNEYVDGVVSNYGYENADALYEYCGNGDAEYGKKYVEDIYLSDRALKKIMETTVVTYTE